MEKFTVRYPSVDEFKEELYRCVALYKKYFGMQGKSLLFIYNEGSKTNPNYK